MKHLTDNEIIDFVSMSNLDEQSLKNASIVTSHITSCEECLRKVRAFQVVFDEFTDLGLKVGSKQELYKVIESRVKKKTNLSSKLELDDNE